MSSLSKDDQRALALLADELFDVSSALDALERRKRSLRDAVLQLCRGACVDRWSHERGTLTIARYSSYKVARPSSVLPLIHQHGWEDESLSVKGRALHKLALGHPDVVRALAAHPKVEHETLVVRRR